MDQQSLAQMLSRRVSSCTDRLSSVPYSFQLVQPASSRTLDAARRMTDARSNHVERATAAAQKQYKSLLTGLQAVGQLKGWKVQQIVLVGGTCGSIHVESFNRNMKALGVSESKWDPIRKKLVRRFLRNRTRCYGPTSHKREGRGARGVTGAMARGGNMSNGAYMREDGACGPWPSDQISSNGGDHGTWVFCLSFSFWG